MEILYLLIPMSAILVLAIIGVFGWALWRGQFEDLEHEGERILLDATPPEGEAPPALALVPAPASSPDAANATVTAIVQDTPNSRTLPDAALTSRPGVVAPSPLPTVPLDADQVAAETSPEQSRPVQQLS